MASNKIQILDYQVLQTIGEGSFGKVKLGVHTKTGHQVAMKIINRKKIANLDMVGRVKREIQYLKLLRHPHIIKLYEVITTPTDIIMVIEFAGRELFDYIVNNGKMAEPVARRFFQQIIGAVEYCHRHKIVHRDLKPENLLLDPYDNVKIADFGLSNIMSDGDFLKTSCGSPNYAAPEVIGGKLYAGPEVDVWSCGVILYVMLCGRLPFDDDYIPHLFKKITEGIFSLPTYLSGDARSLLSSMLVVDPLKRITIQEIRNHPWFAVDLPDYLQPIPLVEQPEYVPLDEEVLKTLERKMSLNKDDILKALNEPQSVNNSVQVAYQLVVDHQQVLDFARNHPHQDVEGYLMSSSPPSCSKAKLAKKMANMNLAEAAGNNAETEDEDDTNHTIRILGSSLPNSSPLSNVGSLRARSFSNGSSSISIGSRRKARTKWHFGIRSRNSPKDVMLEIYRALQQLKMDWKIHNPYHLQCRYIYPHTGIVVKIELQLYRLDNNSYLVDFKNVLPKRSEEGLLKNGSTHTSSDNLSSTGSVQSTKVSGISNSSPYAFFDVCTQLITELAVSS